MWLVEQNSKGIAIVPRLAMEYYIRLWGQSPYTELVTGHLVRLSNPISIKKWFRAFRINWGFQYAKLAMECALSRGDIERKVLIMRKTRVILLAERSIFFFVEDGAHFDYTLESIFRNINWFPIQLTLNSKWNHFRFLILEPLLEKNLARLLLCI